MNVLPEYFRLLREAHIASEAVDDYDLNSSYPESLEQFQKLTNDQERSTIELVDYVTKHGDAIKARLARK